MRFAFKSLVFVGIVFVICLVLALAVVSGVGAFTVLCVALTASMFLGIVVCLGLGLGYVCTRIIMEISEGMATLCFQAEFHTVGRFFADLHGFVETKLASLAQRTQG
jgi:hypothetical protein